MWPHFNSLDQGMPVCPKVVVLDWDISRTKCWKFIMCFYQRIRFLLLSVGWTNRNKFVLSLFGFGFSFFTFANISRPKVQAAGKVAWTFSIFQFLTRSIKHFVRNLHFLYKISSCGNTDTARSEKWCKRIYQVLFDFFFEDPRNICFLHTLCRFKVWTDMKVLQADSIIIGTRKLWRIFPIKQKFNTTAAFFYSINVVKLVKFGDISTMVHPP